MKRKIMTKFHKRGGGGPEALCTTTLKTDWICKNRVHQHKFYGKPRVPKKSSEYDRGSGHFNADEYYLPLWVSSNNNVMTFFEKSCKVHKSTEALFSSERRWTIEELNIPPTSYGFSLRLTVGSVAYVKVHALGLLIKDSYLNICKLQKTVYF